MFSSCLLCYGQVDVKNRTMLIVEKIAGNAHKTVKIKKGITNPVQHATILLNINPQSMARPNSIEEGYQMVGRLPIIDHLKKSPFVLQYWASEKATKFNRALKTVWRKTMFMFTEYREWQRSTNNIDGILFSIAKLDLLDAYRVSLQTL